MIDTIQHRFAIFQTFRSFVPFHHQANRLTQVGSKQRQPFSQNLYQQKNHSNAQNSSTMPISNTAACLVIRLKDRVVASIENSNNEPFLIDTTIKIFLNSANSFLSFML